MRFDTLGNEKNPVILFFHAMGVNGKSSEPVAKYLKDRYFCIMPTSTVYCKGQKYISKADEERQLECFLQERGVKRIAMIVASSIGADLGMDFLAKTELSVDYAFFDGGQFAQISGAVRKIMTPFLYLAIKSLYWSDGKTLKKIMWCDDASIRPYFISAGKELTYGNLYRQMMDSLLDQPFPSLPVEMQKHVFFSFGSIEEHMKYREDVRKAWPDAFFPVFYDCNHMQFQIRDPKGFAEMLIFILKNGKIPDLPLLRQ